MKRLFPLLLALLLLCGCTAGEATQETATIPTSAPALSAGPVTIQPLEQQNPTDLRLMGDSLLLFSGSDKTAITVLDRRNLSVTAHMELDFLLAPHDPSLWVTEQSFSFYDPENRETVLLDDSLAQLRRIAVPGDLVGAPILSVERNALFYAAPTALKCWELGSGIRRTVKEMPCDESTLMGLYLQGTVLGCGNGDAVTFLSGENGLLLKTINASLELTESGGRFWAALSAEGGCTYLFGDAAGETRMLLPREKGACFFLEPLRAALCLSGAPGGELTLRLYDLATGLCRGCLTIPAKTAPIAAAGSSDGTVYLLLEDSLYCWDTASLTPSDAQCYTAVYYTPENPDTEGLARCQEAARLLGDGYGISILLWEDAAICSPWDYEFTAEYQVPILEEALKNLEHWLSHYPGEVLSGTAAHYSGLTLCLVRSIRGTPESGSVAAANGIQFFDGSHAYVALSLETATEQGLYHELFHAMEPVLWAQSSALDSWDTLNPRGFSYDYDYTANAARNAGVYLEGEFRAFVDTYSMSYPKEDRARVMEYAMLPGNEALFRAPALQRKLLTLCAGIRQAFGLEDSPEAYLWEQYLEDSLSAK